METKESSEYKILKKSTTEELRKKLNTLQYKVTQEDGTERPFENEYWENKKEGYGEYKKLFKE